MTNKQKLVDILREIVDLLDSLETNVDRARGRDDSMLGWNPSIIKIREMIDDLAGK